VAAAPARYGAVLSIAVPVLPGTAAAPGSQHTLNIYMPPTTKGDVYMEAAADNFVWIRTFLRAELVQDETCPLREALEGVDGEGPAVGGGAAAAGDSAVEVVSPKPATPKKIVCWCRASSEWRARYRDAEGVWLLKAQYVSRAPAADFAERSRLAREAVLDYYAANHCEIEREGGDSD